MQGTRLKEARIVDGRILFDREWVLIDTTKPETEFRQAALSRTDATGLIKPTLLVQEASDRPVLQFEHPGMSPLILKVPLKPDAKGKHMMKVVTVTNELVNAYSEGSKAADWFSNIVGFKVALVRNLENAPVEQERFEEGLELEQRVDDLKCGWHQDAEVMFQSEESCEALRREAQKADPAVKCTSKQFRPNVVLSGGGKHAAYFEDQLRIIRIRNILFRVVKYGVRCKVVAYDYDKGVKHEKLEPFATILRTRMFPDRGGLFGILGQADVVADKQEFQQLIGDKEAYKQGDARGEAMIREGDKVLVRKTTNVKLPFLPPKKVN